jgi:hypothetical protein
MPAYNPELPDGVNIIDLTPATEKQFQLLPETPVYVVNRGHEVLERKFDGLDYKLHPHTVGHMQMPYGAALHFQKHTTVPGTRDPESGAEQSYLGILGVDPLEMCTPFTPEECARFGIRTEALARDDEDEVRAVPVNKAIATGKIPTGRGKAGRSKGVAFTAKGKTAAGDEVDRDDVMNAGDDTAADRVQRINDEE